MTPVLWVQLILGLIQALSTLAKGTDPIDLPKDITDAKARLHAIVEAIQA